MFSCRRVESAIQSGSLPQLAAQLRQELAALAAKDYSSNSLLQTKKQSLIIDMMHSCNVVEALLAPEGGPAGAPEHAGLPTSPKDWAWARQLKYYADAVRSRQAGVNDRAQQSRKVCCSIACFVRLGDACS